MRRNAVWPIPLLLLLGLCAPCLYVTKGLVCGAAYAAEQDDAGTTGGNAKGDFVDPGEAKPAARVAEGASQAAPASFVDPDDAPAETVVIRDPAAPAPAKVAPASAKRVLEPVISSVEQPINTAYEGTSGQAVGTVAGEAKADETKAAQAAPTPIKEEGAREVVENGFKEAGTAGALGYFKDKSLVKTSFAEAVRRALEKNLSIKYSEKGYEKTAAGISKARSVKDPVFSVAISSVETDLFERREYSVRRRSIAGEVSNVFDESAGAISELTQPAPQGQSGSGAIPGAGGDTLTVVPGFPGVNPGGYPTGTVFTPEVFGSLEAFKKRGAYDWASKSGRNFAETVTASYFQQLPWGPTFSTAFATKYKKIVYQDNVSEDSRHIDYESTDPADPTYFAYAQSAIFYMTDKGGSGSHVLRPHDLAMSANTPHEAFFPLRSRSKNLPQAFTSNLSLQLTVPIPYTKDWGPNGPAEIPFKQAQVSQELAYWTLRGAINDTLLVVNSGYWRVVRAIRSLEVTTANRKSMEQIVKQTDDLLKQNRVTDYDLVQLKTTLTGVQRQEQAWWQEYVQASNALKNILDYDKEVVLLPVNYAPDLAGGITMQTAEALPIAIENNPHLRAARAAVQGAVVNLKYAHNQVRPDLKLTTGMTWAQSDSVYGFNNPGAAWASLARPDSRSGFAVLNFRMPWGNRPAEDRLDEAEQSLQESEKSLGAQANAVARDVNDAVADLASRREQAATTLKNQLLAEKVRDQALELYQQGMVPSLATDRKTPPAFTIVLKEQDVLSRRLDYINAQIRLKQAEANLLAAQGLIAERYANDLKIEIKPVAEPGQPQAAKPEVAKEKKDEPVKAKDAEK